MPGAQIVEPDGIARRDILASFHSRTRTRCHRGADGGGPMVEFSRAMNAKSSKISIKFLASTS
jgi:hypothetical protein